MSAHSKNNTLNSMSSNDAYVTGRTLPNMSAPENYSPPVQKRHFSIAKFIKRLFIFVLVVLLVSAGFLGWKFYENAAKITGDSNPAQLLGLFAPADLKQSDGRVNILLAGYSVDDPNHQGASLTDSIMIVSMDPQTKSAVLLSIPRDTWVDIPGFGYEKINAAYEDGQQENFNQAGYDSGGMGLLEEVIQQDFGVQTDYYGLLDYTAFRDAVNAVGGVTVDIQSPDPRGLYDPNADLNLPNGTITLNGQQALDLARARGDGPGAYGFPQGDFNRTQHQQQLLVALKNKASSGTVLTDPLKVAQLSDAIGNNLKTDMSLSDMATIYRDGKAMSDKTIQSVTLNDINGQDLMQSYYTPDGEDALIPAAGFNDYSQIQAAIQSLFDNSK